MRQQYLTLEDVDIIGKTFLVRADMNSPIDMKTGKVKSDIRIKLHAKTIRELSDKGAKIVVLAHQGRKGDLDFIPLKDHSEILERILSRPVKYVKEVIGDNAFQEIRDLKTGEIIILENIRFHPDETLNKNFKEHGKSELIRNLTELADIFVLDAFSVSHRSHASVIGFTELLPCVAGRAMETELSIIDKITKSVKKPFLCLLGGSKVEKGSDFIDFLITKEVDLILSGGLAGNLLLYASGIDIGKTNLEILEKKWLLEHSKRMAKVLDQNSEKIKLPIDVAVKSKNGNRKEQDVSELPSEYPIYDIGSKTIMNYIKYIKKAKTIFVIGPLGVYEEENFSKGTFEVFNEIAKSNALSIASGGHTVEALKTFNLVDEFTYTSIAGGAFLEYMMGKKLPGTECLRISAEKNKS
ncbi:hypothetical protein AC481_05820 [miscellaneous Crenarchaeota group archaeon SMTZ-80]|nr:MAG: hypothetical protein AC481_05820 [miscellaneous Crenarchaeota group archaeon SMTZ-80]